jgi:hypothetical protein
MNAIIVRNAQTRNEIIKCVASFPYIKPPASAPIPIPNSIKIYKVEIPLPRFSGSLRSVAQANNVGDVMP